MLIIRDTDQFKSEGTAITVGKFDGVHIGHRKLLNVLIKEKGDLETCVFTFDVMSGNGIMDNDNRICSETEKEDILEKMGIDKVVLYPFNEETASVTAENFVKDILVGRLKCRLLVVGDDFRFGRDRSGDTALLKKMSEELGFRLIVVEREKYDGSPVSSSRIREEIKKKNFKKAGEMLGR